MTRKQTVSYKPGNGPQKPMIRIANRFLVEYGFKVGSKIEIGYENDIITITRLASQNDWRAEKTIEK